MLKLDHLAIIAPSLAEGADHVRDQLGIDMPAGGRHPQMGTHNLLLRLGEGVFLEVIAVDPAAGKPDRPRWFGLDDVEAVREAWRGGRRLRGWVARTTDLDAVLAAHGCFLGARERISRGDRSWSFAVPADGALPMDGLAPSVMDWGERGSAAPSMPDLGVSLLSFRIGHPQPEKVEELYRSLKIVDPPEVRKAEAFHYSAILNTPSGTRRLS